MTIIDALFKWGKAGFKLIECLVAFADVRVGVADPKVSVENLSELSVSVVCGLYKSLYLLCQGRLGEMPANGRRDLVLVVIKGTRSQYLRLGSVGKRPVITFPYADYSVAVDTLPVASKELARQFNRVHPHGW